MKINWFNSEKYFFIDKSVKRQITDSISKNLSDSDLESKWYLILKRIFVRNIHSFVCTKGEVAISELNKFQTCNFML